MDLAETPAQVEARSRYRAWLDDFLPAGYYERFPRYRDDLALRSDYQRAAFEAGWLMPHWEPGLGGQRLGALETLAVRLEAAATAAPKLPNIQGPNVVAPALRTHGTPQQRERYLVPLLRGDDWWALGMSEPESGSDFASLRTAAIRRDGHFAVSGQKVWTSHAHHSRFATLYCRTDRAAPKHRGISCLILDLASPGVTVRPIRMAAPSADAFCEVFLDDVQVPAGNLLGPLNSGWEVAMASLTDERDMIWVMNWADLDRGLRRAASLLRGHKAGDLLVDLGRRLADVTAIRVGGLRTASARAGGAPAALSLALKLAGSEALQRTWEFAIEAAGPAAAVDVGDLLFEDFDGLGATIYGGTSEIQRNIIGERVLGLPKG
jgi:alkylation response protein AidB-like acyl-CoA dehydrogenase